MICEAPDHRRIVTDDGGRQLMMSRSDDQRPTARDPGLDLAQLRGLVSATSDLSLFAERIEEHLDAHEGYIAFSGGKDSLAVVDQARQVDPETPVVFFDSGLEYPETYTYIADLAEAWSLNLHVIKPRQTALEVLAASGTWDHDALTRPVSHLGKVLIEEPAARAHQLYGPGELWGVRAAESAGRRMAYARALQREIPGCDCATAQQRRRRHGGVIHRKDGTVAYGPIWDWSTEQVWEHIARGRLPVNPVYARLREIGAPEEFLRVSHVIDGGRLNTGRATWLRRGWPGLFDELAAVLPRLREFV